MKTLTMEIPENQLQCHVQLVRELENTLQLSSDEFARLIQFHTPLWNYARVVEENVVMINHVIGFRRWVKYTGEVFFDRFMLTPKGAISVGTTSQKALQAA